MTQGILSGNLPTLSRWVRSGTHTAAEWWARVPSTTPASQAGLLHGSTDGSRRSAGTRSEHRAADGGQPARGRRADRAAALGRPGPARRRRGERQQPLHRRRRRSASGDEPAGRWPGSARRRLRRASSPARSSSPRGLLLTIGEMVKELYQGRRQRVRGVEPRVPRTRGVRRCCGRSPTSLLRDLNVVAGRRADDPRAPGRSTWTSSTTTRSPTTPAPLRPESLDALEGLDAVLGHAPAGRRTRRRRPTDFVVLSDHGQSQGATFRQLLGRDARGPVTALAGGPGRSGGRDRGRRVLGAGQRPRVRRHGRLVDDGALGAAALGRRARIGGPRGAAARAADDGGRRRRVPGSSSRVREPGAHLVPAPGRPGDAGGAGGAVSGPGPRPHRRARCGVRGRGQRARAAGRRTPRRPGAARSGRGGGGPARTLRSPGGGRPGPRRPPWPGHPTCWCTRPSTS